MLTSKKLVVPDGNQKTKGSRFRKPLSMSSTIGAKKKYDNSSEEGINLDELKKSMDEIGLGDVSIVFSCCFYC